MQPTHACRSSPDEDGGIGVHAVRASLASIDVLYLDHLNGQLIDEAAGLSLAILVGHAAEAPHSAPASANDSRFVCLGLTARPKHLVQR